MSDTINIGDIVEVREVEGQGLTARGMKRAEVIDIYARTALVKPADALDKRVRVFLEDLKRIDVVTAIGDLDGD